MQSDELTMERLAQLARRYAWAMQRPALELHGTTRWHTANRIAQRCASMLITAAATRSLPFASFWSSPANARDLCLAVHVFAYCASSNDIGSTVYYGQRLLNAALKYAEKAKEQG